MKCQGLFSMRIKRKYFKMLSAAVVIGTLRINYVFPSLIFAWAIDLSMVYVLHFDHFIPYFLVCMYKGTHKGQGQDFEKKKC